MEKTMLEEKMKKLQDDVLAMRISVPETIIKLHEKNVELLEQKYTDPELYLPLPTQKLSIKKNKTFFEDISSVQKYNFSKSIVQIHSQIDALQDTAKFLKSYKPISTNDKDILRL